MAQKKEGQSDSKPGVKVQDLSPKKDAKGGAQRNADGGGGGNLNALRNENSLRNQDGALNQNSTKNLD